MESEFNFSSYNQTMIMAYGAQNDFSNKSAKIDHETLQYLGVTPPLCTMTEDGRKCSPSNMTIKQVAFFCRLNS